MKYFGIKIPDKGERESYIWWISDSAFESWRMFFEYPNRHKELNSFRLPLGEAIQAYEGIGYKCVELDIKEKVK